MVNVKLICGGKQALTVFVRPANMHRDLLTPVADIPVRSALVISSCVDLVVRQTRRRIGVTGFSLMPHRERGIGCRRI